MLFLRWLIYAAALSTLIVGNHASAEPLAIEYRGKKLLAEKTAADQYGRTITIGELSGITWCGGDNYIAVMNGSNLLFALGVTLEDNGAIKAAAVSACRSIDIPRDYEGIAYTNPSRHSVFLSEEATPGPPALHEFRMSTGVAMQSISLPVVFDTQRDNFGLESLTRRSDGREMWTANEEALAADGPLSTPAAGSVVRLQRLRVDGNRVTPAEQYAYLTEPIHVGGGSPPSRSGLADLVVLEDGTLLALERSCGIGFPPFRTSIFQIDLTGATDISQPPLNKGLGRLTIGKDYKPVKKTLLISTGAIGENVEGLCLGPKLASGGRALVGVVDDGGQSDPLSNNTLVSFELLASPKPSIVPLVAAAGGLAIAGIVLLVGLRGRRRRKLAAV